MSSCSQEFIRTQCNYKNDYECRRKCNISKLKELYEKELNNYYTQYNKYLQYKYDRSSSSKQAEAENVIKPKVIRINNNLNKILADLKKNIEHTQELIQQQEGDINTKNNNIYKRNKQITDQYNTIVSRQDELESKNRQIDTGIERNQYKRNTMYFLIFLNIVIISVLAGILIKK